MATLETNAKFATVTLKNLCSTHGLPTEWATKRQASKYRMNKGRIYNEVKSVVKKVQPIANFMGGN